MNDSTSLKIIKNTGWLYAKIAVNMFIVLYTTRLILKGMGAIDYGIFNIVGGAITMLGFFNSTMAHATQRFMNYCEGEGNFLKLKQIFNVGIILHFGVALIIGFIFTIIGLFFFDDILNIPEERIVAAKVVYGSLIVSTIFTVLTSPYEAAMNAHENFKYFALVSVFENILKLGVAFACLYTHYDKLMVYGVLMGCIPLITLSIMRYYCHKNYEECLFNPKIYYSPTVAKEMTSFAGWNFLAATTSLVGNSGMSLVLNSFYGVLLNAAQGIATQVGGAFMNLSANAIKALTPMLTKSEGSNDRVTVHYMTILGCRVPYYITTAFSIPLFFLTPEILNIWLTETPEWAILFTRLQIIKNVMDLLFRNLSTAIYAQGNIKLFTITSSFFFILPLFIVAIVFYLGYPPSYLYIVWIVVNFLGGINTLIVCQRVTNLSIKQFLEDVLARCLAVTITSVLPYLLWIDAIESVEIKVMANLIMVTFFIVLGYRFILKHNERKQIKGFVKNLASRFLSFLSSKLRLA